MTHRKVLVLASLRVVPCRQCSQLLCHTCGALTQLGVRHPGRGKGTGGNPTADMDLVRSVAQAAADAAAAALRGWCPDCF